MIEKSRFLANSSLAKNSFLANEFLLYMIK